MHLVNHRFLPSSASRCRGTKRSHNSATSVSASRAIAVCMTFMCDNTVCLDVTGVYKSDVTRIYLTDLAVHVSAQADGERIRSTTTYCARLASSSTSVNNGIPRIS